MLPVEPVEPAPSSRSSLDLVAAPGSLPPGPISYGQAPAPQEMLKPLTAMLNDPKLTQGMPEDQARQMRELSSFLKQIAGGKTPDPQQLKLMMQKFQSLAAPKERGGK